MGFHEQEKWNANGYDVLKRIIFGTPNNIVLDKTGIVSLRNYTN